MWRIVNGVRSNVNENVEGSRFHVLFIDFDQEISLSALRKILHTGLYIFYCSSSYRSHKKYHLVKLNYTSLKNCIDDYKYIYSHFKNHVDKNHIKYAHIRKYFVLRDVHNPREKYIFTIGKAWYKNISLSHFYYFKNLIKLRFSDRNISIIYNKSIGSIKRMRLTFDLYIQKK